MGRRLPKGCFSGGDIYSYRWILDMLPNNGIMVEVGTFAGRSICSIAEQIIRKNIEVHCVDLFIKTEPSVTAGQDLTALAFKDRPEGQAVRDSLLESLDLFGIGNAEVIVDDSAKAAELFCDESLDMVFIDAGHLYPQVIADIRAWWPKLKSRGIMSGHDYIKRDIPDINGVSEACHKFFGGPELITKNKVQRQTLVWHVKKAEALGTWATSSKNS